MNEQTVLYVYNGIVLRHKKEWAINIPNNMDDSQSNYDEWKMPEKKEYIVFDSIYITLS